MSTDNQARVLGNTSGMGEQVTISTWTPPTRKQLATKPALPAPPPRPVLAVAPSATGRGMSMQKVAGGPPTRPSYIPADSLRGRVWDQADDGARILQDMVLSDRPPAVKVDAGILLVVLGDEVASELIKRLNWWALVEVTTAVSQIKEVDPKDEQRVAVDFDENLRARQWVRQGGVEYARRLLDRAVGRGKATSIMEATTEVTSPRFHLLRQLPPRDVAPFIVHEHPQTIALILSQLAPEQAAATLDQLAEDLQKDIAYRIATLENVTPAVLKLVEESIEAILRNVLGGNQDVGGPKILADILNLTGSSTERTVLESLDGSSHQLGEKVRNVMFTFDDIGKLAGQDLGVLVKAFSLDDWAVALKAAQAPVKQRVKEAMGETQWQELIDKMEYLGPMRLRDVEALQIQMVHRVREMEAAGSVTIVRGTPDPYV